MSAALRPKVELRGRGSVSDLGDLTIIGFTRAPENGKARWVDPTVVFTISVALWALCVLIWALVAWVRQRRARGSRTYMRTHVYARNTRTATDRGAGGGAPG